MLAYWRAFKGDNVLTKDFSFACEQQRQQTIWSASVNHHTSLTNSCFADRVLWQEICMIMKLKHSIVKGVYIPWSVLEQSLKTKIFTDHVWLQGFILYIKHNKGELCVYWMNYVCKLHNMNITHVSWKLALVKQRCSIACIPSCSSAHNTTGMCVCVFVCQFVHAGVAGWVVWYFYGNCLCTLPALASSNWIL